MMLYLEVQPAYKPGNNLVPGSEVGRSLYLVHRPFIGHFAIAARRGELSMLYRMRKLEHYAYDKTSKQRGCKESCKPCAPAHHINRQPYEQEVMQQLERPENKMIVQAHVLQRHGAYLAFEIFRVIQHEYPQDVQHGIQQPEI